MRTFIPSTSFISSPQTEKERLLYATTAIAMGFYPKHDFIITPFLIPKYENFCVIIPPSIKSADQKYWKDAKKAGLTMPKVLTKHMWNKTKHINMPAVDSKIVSKFETNWKKVEQKFWQELGVIFPNEVKWIKSLEIRITNIGSRGSHYLLTKSLNQHLIINVRTDGNTSSIADLIILALIYPLCDDLDLTFTGRQIIRNFIMSRQNFKKMFPDWKSRKYNNYKIPTKLIKKSHEYIYSLGVPKIVDSVEILVKNLGGFGVKEEKLINLLIKNRNELVTYDEIADKIWGLGEFKSYWAINKLVQRILIKIKKLKIDGVKIIGVRGRGYKLV